MEAEYKSRDIKVTQMNARILINLKDMPNATLWTQVEAAKQFYKNLN